MHNFFLLRIMHSNLTVIVKNGINTVLIKVILNVHFVPKVNISVSILRLIYGQ